MSHLWPKQWSNNYRKVPIINLSTIQLVDISPLEHSLKQCFVDKNKYKKKYIAVEFETLFSSHDKDISSDDEENFHELLRSATNTFTQNIYRTYYNTYNVLKPLKGNKDIVLLSGDKDLSVVILDKSFIVILEKVPYKEKNNRLINDGISKGVCVIEENDNTWAEFKSF